MFDNEVLIEKKDKETLMSNIKIINDILDKYAYSTNHNLHTVTSMSRVKTLSRETEEWIKLLYTKND